MNQRACSVGMLAVAGLIAALEPASADNIDCRVRPLPRIAAGTVIPDGPPAGYSYLLFKNHSELASGNLDELPGFAKMLAEFLFTTIVARVEVATNQDRRSFELNQVAIGLGTRSGARDIVISSERHAEFGVELGPFKKIVLARAEDRLKRVLQVVRSKQMFLIDAPTIMRIGAKHRPVVLRYLLLVQPDSGETRALAWLIGLDGDGNYASISKQAILVRPNLVSTSKLHVDEAHIRVGIPDAEAFALTRMPPGEALKMAPDLRTIAVKRVLTPGEALRLQRGFQGILGQQAR